MQCETTACRKNAAVSCSGCGGLFCGRHVHETYPGSGPQCDCCAARHFREKYAERKAGERTVVRNVMAWILGFLGVILGVVGVTGMVHMDGRLAAFGIGVGVALLVLAIAIADFSNW